VTVEGEDHDFTLEVAEGHPSGLYRQEVTIEDKQHVSGWVVLNDGREKGMALVNGTPQRAGLLIIYSTALKPRPTISPD
jgi:hypothetical protein